jgi:two-component sensor histidine kinase
MNLKLIFLILFFIPISISANTINLDETTNSKNILNSSQIYIDKINSLDIHEIIKQDDKFMPNTKEKLSYGYSPSFSVWIKFTLKNTSNKTITKVLEYNSPLTTEVILFNSSASIIKKDGLFNTNQDRRTVNPIFEIELTPFQSKTYYLKASSYITTLIIELNLFNTNYFSKKETRHQVILSLFFGAMLVLSIYNLFIFFFTKDISYFYYSLYIIGIIIHHFMYVGFSNIYLLDQTSIKFITNYAALIVSFPIYSLAFYIKFFLKTNLYPSLNKILNLFLFLIPISVLILSITDIFNQYRNIFALSLFVYLFFITIYATYKKSKQAYLILIGWLIIVTASILMFLSGLGIFDFTKNLSYIVEIAFITEAIIFSIALATKINKLQNEKNIANEKLILQQKNEKMTLKIEVEKKTFELQILLKELNHRVKNNMQTIVSLIRLQSRSIKEQKYKDILIVIQNRINTMSHLHELLYTQDDTLHVNTQEYFNILINEINHSYKYDIKINIVVTIQLKMEYAIYCGLILNELISNSYKYAFNDKKEGIINIIFSQNIDGIYTLIVKDNGVGYDQNKKTNTMGTILIKNLVNYQLCGHINIKSNDGVKVIITWRDNEEI